MIISDSDQILFRRLVKQVAECRIKCKAERITRSESHPLVFRQVNGRKPDNAVLSACGHMHIQLGTHHLGNIHFPSDRRFAGRIRKADMLRTDAEDDCLGPDSVRLQLRCNLSLNLDDGILPL